MSAWHCRLEYHRRLIWAPFSRGAGDLKRYASNACGRRRGIGHDARRRGRHGASSMLSRPSKRRALSWRGEYPVRCGPAELKPRSPFSCGNMSSFSAENDRKRDACRSRPSSAACRPSQLARAARNAHSHPSSLSARATDPCRPAPERRRMMGCGFSCISAEIKYSSARVTIVRESYR